MAAVQEASTKQFICQSKVVPKQHLRGNSKALVSVEMFCCNIPSHAHIEVEQLYFLSRLPGQEECFAVCHFGRISSLPILHSESSALKLNHKVL